MVCLPAGVTLAIIPGKIWRWFGTEIRIEDNGIHFGKLSRERPLHLVAITWAHYWAPWDAVSNFRIVPRSRATFKLAYMAKIYRQYNRGNWVVPGYIPDNGTHTLIFDVDIVKAEPKAGLFHPLRPYRDLFGRYKGLNPRRSSVWAFPIRNRKKVTEVLRQRGFEVTIVKSYKGQGPKWVNTPSPGEYGYQPPA